MCIDKAQNDAGKPHGLPKVWLDLDQASLDAAYDQTVYAPNCEQIVKRMATNSALLRERIGEPRVLSYGTSSIQKLFYYPPRTANVPIQIHVHGGAWRQRKAEGVFFPAEAFISSGIGFAVFDFISVDETNGDLNPVLAQVREGLVWLAKNAREIGGDPDRLYLSGFSSGAYLVSVVILTDWSKSGITGNPYKGAVLASGLYDLRPVRLSKRSEYVAFTDEVEESMSAQRHVEKFDIPVVLVHGSYETPEFQRQTREFAAALQGRSRERVNRYSTSWPRATITTRLWRVLETRTGLSVARQFHRSFSPRKGVSIGTL